MHDRMEFIREYLTGRWTMTDLCRRFSISRRTGYKFVRRFEQDGPSGLEDRSRAPHNRPSKTDPEVERRILKAAKRLRRWGPRKLLRVLRCEQPEIDWPAKSTIGDIRARHGLTTPRRLRRRRTPAPPDASLTQPSTSNDVWAIDFKGWFLSRDRRRCEPLVVADLYSRFCTVCRLVPSIDSDTVWKHLTRAFRTYGMPKVLRSDNGPPFASTGIGGLTPLVIKLLKVGIIPERIEPGRPYMNGCLERFNLTLMLEACDPPCDTWEEQDLALQRFQRQFNQVRPHEGLDDLTPAAVYVPAPVKTSLKLEDFEYPDYVYTRRVRQDGSIRWRGRLLFLSECVSTELVGFRQIGSCHWSVLLGPIELAIFNEEEMKFLKHDRLVWADDDTP